MTASWRFRPLPSATSAAAMVLLVGTLLAAVLGAVVAGSVGTIRYVVAVLLIIDLLALIVRFSRAGLVVAICVLPFIAGLRRVFIPVAGYGDYDPLLVIGPLLALAVLHTLFFVQHRPLAPDRLSRLVLGVLCLTVIEVFNPGSGGVLAGVLGLLFVGAPLLWFFVGRELSDERLIGALLAAVVVIGCVVSLYGLAQSNIGLLPWDSAWVAEVGGRYNALQVNGVIRSFSTLSSAGEYAAYLAVALAVAAALVVHGRLWALPAIPLMGYALFLESTRGALVLTVVAIMVMISLRSVGPRSTLVILCVGVFGIFVGQQFLSRGVQSGSISSTNPLISHQLAGLADPLNDKASTAPGHLTQIVNGVTGSFSHPLGLGPGASNIAGTRTKAANTGGSEFDISDAFIDLGVAGGVAYLALVIGVFRAAIQRAFARRDLLAAAVVGVLVVSFGQWLNGANYAVSPLIWFLAGWSTRTAVAAATTDPVTAPPVTAGPRRSPTVGRGTVPAAGT